MGYRTKHPDRNKRLQFFFKSLNVNREDFAKKVGTTYQNLSQLLRGHGNISESMAFKIGKAYPELNLEWLMEGEGIMAYTVYEIDENSAGEPAELPPGDMPEEPKTISVEELPAIIRHLLEQQEILAARVKALEDRLNGQPAGSLPAQVAEDKENP